MFDNITESQKRALIAVVVASLIWLVVQAFGILGIPVQIPTLPAPAAPQGSAIPPAFAAPISGDLSADRGRGLCDADPGDAWFRLRIPVGACWNSARQALGVPTF